ncbi:MAG: hypothetical protein DRP00_00265 [Candidatus Aenigmatarchaeota archaeon]|nr:MAG: hypothetical protein DRP00_00265 [Candidatus Aenigmarchaeota archaeon]
MALPEFSGSFYQNFYYFFLPFIFVFAIFFGILSLANVFSKKINIVISIIVALALAPTDFYPFITNYLLRLGAWIVLIAFVLIFVVGVALVTAGKGREIYRKTLSPTERLAQIEKENKKIDEKILKARKKGNVKEEEKLWVKREGLVREYILTSEQVRKEAKLRRRWF